MADSTITSRLAGAAQTARADKSRAPQAADKVPAADQFDAILLALQEASATDSQLQTEAPLDPNALTALTHSGTPQNNANAEAPPLALPDPAATLNPATLLAIQSTLPSAALKDLTPANKRESKASDEPVVSAQPASPITGPEIANSVAALASGATQAASPTAVAQSSSTSINSAENNRPIDSVGHRGSAAHKAALTETLTPTNTPPAENTQAGDANFSLPPTSSEPPRLTQTTQTPQSAGDVATIGMTQAASATAIQPQERRSDPAPTLSIQTPVGQTGWAEEVGESVTLMVSKELSSAELVLNPPELGPIEITLNIEGDQASAYFVSPSAEVRTALEDALPRLREMLADSGLTLGNTSIDSQREAREQASQQRSPRTPYANTRDTTDEPRIIRESIGTFTPRGRVDIFA